MNTQDTCFKAYLDYFENLTKENVQNLKSLVTSDFHFVDPFNDLNDVNAVIHVFEAMFKKLNEPTFKMVEVTCEKNLMYATWDFSFSSILINYGKRSTIRGLSVVRKNESNLIYEHIDYWDASKLFAQIPVIGWLLVFLRKYAS